MNIAIVSKFGHMECVGFLLELLKEHSVTIVIDKQTDKYNWLQYFKTLYHFSIENVSNMNVHNYTILIKLTSNDNCLNTENTVSIVHVKENQYVNNKSSKYISLTPYINGDNIYYNFPIYNPPIQKSNSKIVTLIGYYNNTQIDHDLLSFVKTNSTYQFVFIIWGSGSYNVFNGISNITLLQNVDASHLIQHVYKTKYILSKKHINYDRFSGQLSLAMSFHKPLIIDTKSANAYNIPGFTFNEKYSELNNLDNISDEQYDNMIDQIKLFNTNALIANANNIKDIIYNKDV